MAILAALMPIELKTPSLDLLPQYVDALKRGWSPDNVRKEEAAREQLAEIGKDEAAFVARLDDPEGRGAPVKMPDGATMRRLPGFHRWIFDGAFCGTIGFRWQKGTPELPTHVLGHIGFAVVPWRRRRGCATAALRLILPEARNAGLPYVELTTDLDNVASQRVILANGGALIGRFQKPSVYGGMESLRYRIAL
jgi:predicted acetyltransferase